MGLYTFAKSRGRTGEAQWYQRFGATRLIGDPLQLILPFAVLAGAEREAEKT